MRDSKIQRVLTKTPEDWKNLKETIDLVSDSLTEDVEIEGVLIAVNFKTKAFVIQAGGDYISGRFRENVISKSKAAEIPKDYRFFLKKTVRRNFATDRMNTEHLLVNLVRRSGHKPSSD